jgi:hypothetical protein
VACSDLTCCSDEGPKNKAERKGEREEETDWRLHGAIIGVPSCPDKYSEQLSADGDSAGDRAEAALPKCGAAYRRT